MERVFTLLHLQSRCGLTRFWHALHRLQADSGVKVHAVLWQFDVAIPMSRLASRNQLVLPGPEHP